MEMFLGLLVMVVCAVIGFGLQGSYHASAPAEDAEEARNASSYAGQLRAYDRHVGPNGGVYRLSASGRKIYLKKNGTNHHRKSRVNGWGF